MVRNLKPDEAHDLIQAEGYTYVDVRTEREFAGGHPAGSVNVPAFVAGPGGMMPNPMFLQVMERVYPSDAKLVLGCAMGGRSGRACQLLEAAGYTDLVNVDGGFSGARNDYGVTVKMGWNDLDLPVSTDTAGVAYADMQQRARES